MRFVYRGGVDHDLQLRLRRSHATVGDLGAALGAPAGIRIDGRDTRPETALSESGFVMGSQVAPAGPSPVVEPTSLAVLRVVGGLMAGVSAPLPPGKWLIGRGTEVDIHVDAQDVSRIHCASEIAADGAVMLWAPWSQRSAAEHDATPWLVTAGSATAAVTPQGTGAAAGAPGPALKPRLLSRRRQPAQAGVQVGVVAARSVQQH
jgi:hypothetical protein